MPNIIAREKPKKGDEFNVRTNLLAKVGSAFSVMFGGRRVGLARVIRDFSDDDRFQVEVHGGYSKYGKKYCANESGAYL